MFVSFSIKSILCKNAFNIRSTISILSNIAPTWTMYNVMYMIESLPLKFT